MRIFEKALIGVIATLCVVAGLMWAFVPMSQALAVIPDRVDLGNISATSAADPKHLHPIVFEVRNRSSTVVLLRNTQASCGCVVVDSKQVTLDPGSSTQVHVQLDTAKQQGQFKHEVLFFVEDSGQLRCLRATILGTAPVISTAEASTDHAGLSIGDGSVTGL